MQWGVVMEIKWLFHTAMLGFCSIQDIKTKQISLWKLILYGLVVFIMDIWKLLAGGEEFTHLFLYSTAGMVPGLGLLLLAKATNEAVGYGDGLFMLVLGFSLGFWNGLGVLATALAGVFLTALWLYLSGKRGRVFRIPFLPFLFAGTAGAILWI